MVSFWNVQLLLSMSKILNLSSAFVLTERITTTRSIKNQISMSFHSKPYHNKYVKRFALSNRSSTMELEYNDLEYNNITFENNTKKIDDTIIFRNDDYVSSLVSEPQRIWKKRDATTSSISIEKLSDLAIFALGASSLTLGIGNVLTNFEIVQTWRYFWPLLGCLYIWDGIFCNEIDDGNIQKKLLLSSLFTNKVEKQTSIRNSIAISKKYLTNNLTYNNRNAFNKSSISSYVLRAITVMCGFGLIIGGAYDAFMPVWMTGPNAFTNAGIHQDSAMILLVLSIYTFFSRKLNYYFNDVESTKIMALEKQDDSTVTLLQMLLLAQLYLLSESAIDEILSNVFSFFV